jgi:protoheme IX farnesyltransferase|tara:strand:+ start:20604 stop:21500 length:897 start_codon:yes stop_codon:yes gene_type:complete
MQIKDSINFNSSLASFVELTKLKVVLLLVFTAIVGMLLASDSYLQLRVLLYGSLGIGLTAASGAVINHIFDVRIDSKMSRTSNRPLPTGKISEKKALIFAFFLGSIGLTTLILFINLLTAALTFLSLIGYAVVYTIYLKRSTSQNIVIGGAAGATPPVLGWAAVNNEVSLFSLILFLIIFIWTPPHFWSLAIARKDDYEKANIPMLPVTHGIDVTKIYIIIYTILLFIITLLPYILNMAGDLYLAGSILLGLGFMFYVVKLKYNNGLAMEVFIYSINYLIALFCFLLADHYILLIAPY